MLGYYNYVIFISHFFPQISPFPISSIISFQKSNHALLRLPPYLLIYILHFLPYFLCGAFLRNIFIWTFCSLAMNILLFKLDTKILISIIKFLSLDILLVFQILSILVVIFTHIFKIFLLLYIFNFFLVYDFLCIVFKDLGPQ